MEKKKIIVAGAVILGTFAAIIAWVEARAAPLGTPDMSIGIITDTDVRCSTLGATCWITLDALIRNQGDGGGDWSVEWYVNGVPYCSTSGYLAAGAHAFANAPYYNPNAYGTYDIDVIFNWNGHPEEYHRQCIVHQY